MPYGWTNEQLDEAINRLGEPLAEFEAAGQEAKAAQMRRMIERLEGMKTKEEEQK